MTTSLNAFERETVVTASDGDALVTIWTHQRRYITKLRKHPKVTEVATGFDGGTEWAQFTVPADQWNPVSGVKRTSTMTDAQKAGLRDRLAATRKSG